MKTCLIFPPNKYFFPGATTLLLHYLTLFSKCRNLPGSAAAAEHYVVYQMLLSNSDEAICGACSFPVLAVQFDWHFLSNLLAFSDVPSTSLPLYPSTPLQPPVCNACFATKRRGTLKSGLGWSGKKALRPDGRFMQRSSRLMVDLRHDVHSFRNIPSTYFSKKTKKNRTA